MTTIVLIMGSAPSQVGLSGLPGEASILQQLLEHADKVPAVTLLSLGVGRQIAGLQRHIDLGAVALPMVDRVLRVVGAYRLRSKLATFPIGRLLNSMGPLDQGRVFWRTVRRNPEALEALRHADTAIAADMPAVKTAWLALRRDWVDEAHYDHRSASVGVTFELPVAPSDADEK